MAEGSGINKTQVLVAVITVSGGLLAAIIANADKWIFRERPRPATQVEPAPVQPAAPSDISGVWRDDDGARFSFTQSGSQYEYVHTAIHGTLQSAGRGTITGRDLSHDFELPTGETGTCTGRVDAAATRITGSCLFQDGGWTFVLER